MKIKVSNSVICELFHLLKKKREKDGEIMSLANYVFFVGDKHFLTDSIISPIVTITY